MNEKIDLTKILKNCPKGWKFWSPIFGEVEFAEIFKNNVFVNVKQDEDVWSFLADATFPLGDIKSIEIMLYPSKSQRDWSKFTAPWYKKEKFDPKTLKAFDRILARHTESHIWFPDFYSFHIDDRFTTVGKGYYSVIIPYNEETKHLVGTTEEAPEYYRYWED